MQIDLETYSASKRVIINWLSGRNPKDLLGNISMIATSTHCPCIVVAYFAGEAFGWTEELAQYIRRLIDFYGYDEITNKPEGSPV